MFRHFRCPGCGAERETLADMLHVLCSFCGGWIGADSSGFLGGAAYGDVLQRTRDVLKAGSGAARLAGLHPRMERAAQTGDRTLFRAIAHEYHSLIALLYPELVPGSTDTQQRRDWLRSTVAMAEIQAFDSQIAALDAERQAATAALSRSKSPISDARRLLEANRAYLAAIANHPDYADLPPFDVGHRAKEMLRMSVNAMVISIGTKQVQRILTEVLDERKVTGEARCASCGAEMSLHAGVLQCAYCKAVVRVDTQDPWLKQMRGVWQATRPAHREEPGQRTLTALSAVLHATVAITEQSARLFLREALSELDEEELNAGRRRAQGIEGTVAGEELLAAITSAAAAASRSR